MSMKEINMLIDQKTPKRVKRELLRRNRLYVNTFLYFIDLLPIMLIISFLLLGAVPYDILRGHVKEFLISSPMLSPFAMLVAWFVDPRNLLLYRLHRIGVCRFCATVADNKYHSIIKLDNATCNYQVRLFCQSTCQPWKITKAPVVKRYLTNFLAASGYPNLLIGWFACIGCIAVAVAWLYIILACLCNFIGLDTTQCDRVAITTIEIWVAFGCYFIWFGHAAAFIKWYRVSHKLGIKNMI